MQDTGETYAKNVGRSRKPTLEAKIQVRHIYEATAEHTDGDRSEREDVGFLSKVVKGAEGVLGKGILGVGVRRIALFQ